MRLSPAQRNDIELCKYFHACSPTEEQIVEYLTVSERGEGKTGKFSHNPLVIGKTRRGLTMGMWEEGVLEGTVPYLTLLGGYEEVIQRKWWNPMRWVQGKIKLHHKPIPRFVVDFMKKEMFKGADADVIENCYRTLVNESVE